MSCLAEPLQKKKKKFETMPKSMVIYESFYELKVVYFVALYSELITFVKKLCIGQDFSILSSRLDASLTCPVFINLALCALTLSLDISPFVAGEPGF